MCSLETDQPFSVAGAMDIYSILRTCNSRHSYYKFFSMFKVGGDGLGSVQYEELHRCFKIGPIQVDVVRLR